jgi:hypothetical protein
MRVIRDLWLCEDCMIAAVNDDYGGIDFSFGVGTPENAARCAEVRKGLERLGPHLAYNSDENEGRLEFSWRECDCCRSRLGGSRERFAILGE